MVGTRRVKRALLVVTSIWPDYRSGRRQTEVSVSQINNVRPPKRKNVCMIIGTDRRSRE